MYPSVNPSHFKCSRTTSLTLQQQFLQTLHGHNILFPLAELLKANSKKLSTPFIYSSVCLGISIHVLSMMHLFTKLSVKKINPLNKYTYIANKHLTHVSFIAHSNNKLS